MISPATAGTTVLADEATLLVHQALMAAIGALLSLGLSAVGDVLLQRTLHTYFPSVDAFTLELQRADQFENMLDRHAVAQHA